MKYEFFLLFFLPNMMDMKFNIKYFVLIDKTFQLVSHSGLSPVGIHYTTGLVLLRFHSWPSFFGGALQFVHSLSVRIGGPSSLVHRPFLSSPCVPCFLQFARFPSHFSRECEEKSNETKRFLPNRLRKCKNDSFFAHPSIRQRIQVRFDHSFFDTHSGFCFGFELLFWFAKNLGFEFCGLMIFM